MTNVERIYMYMLAALRGLRVSGFKGDSFFLMIHTCTSCSVRGRALTCLAAAAGSESSEVREAVKRTIQAQTATDPLLQTPRGMLMRL